MTITNAQAALQAAVTVFSGRMKALPVQDEVKMLAQSFKNWLDTQDGLKEGAAGRPMLTAREALDGRRKDGSPL